MENYQYSKIKNKLAEIKSMNPDAYLNLFHHDDNWEESIQQGIAFAVLKNEHSNISMNHDQFILDLLCQHPNLLQNNLLLKTMYIETVFAHQKVYHAIANLDPEIIAITFDTDLNTVKCKYILERKLQSISPKENKTYQKRNS